jgi:hypothetical protein
MSEIQVQKSTSSDADKKKKKKKKTKTTKTSDKTSQQQPLLRDVELDHPVFKASGWAEVEVKEAVDHKYAITGYECKYQKQGIIDGRSLAFFPCRTITILDISHAPFSFLYFFVFFCV